MLRVPNIVSKREIGLFIPMIATVGVWVEESPSFLPRALQNDVNTTFFFFYSSIFRNKHAHMRERMRFYAKT